MLRNKKFLIVLVLVLIIILIGIYFYLKSIKQGQVQPGLTDEERTAILNELSSQVEVDPLLEKERDFILKDLNSASSNGGLTDEERTAILNSLNQ
ncbi:hypothetical protein KKA39_00690 [Patescibacteria group bacterium]|nr:hypothetical protein [Patescibacteria group bacterium]MBU1727817.1 hypothetical protein [Patescibacteria group bacterium]